MKKNRVTVYFNDIQFQVFKELMEEDLMDNQSIFIVRLIAEEKKRRDEIKNKRGRGRPQKEAEEEAPEYEEPDYSDDVPKTIMHYGRMIGKREMADIEARTREHNQQHHEG